MLGRHELPIACEADIVLVRRKARSLAQAYGFDAFATAAITTAASELARNCWVHGGGGAAVVEELYDGTRHGLAMEFRDTGPGIGDVEWALAGGHSTTRSLGLGLSGSRRLVDEFALETARGEGTTVRIVKWKRF
ncbi:MAG: anti-sigma regulatory factor [Myxococcales bacterium]|nr:anti-sigma regulatory factor [Myxococcales bacterium]